MNDLPHQATNTLLSVSEFSHLKEPIRSRWIRCSICKQVPTENVYRVHIPQQAQGDKRSFAVGTACCSEDCVGKWLAKYKPHFYTLEEMEGSALLPTQEQKPGWIHCFHKTGVYPDSTRRRRLSRNMVFVDGNSKLANIWYPNGLRKCKGAVA